MNVTKKRGDRKAHCAEIYIASGIKVGIRLYGRHWQILAGIRAPIPPISIVFVNIVKGGEWNAAYKTRIAGIGG